MAAVEGVHRLMIAITDQVLKNCNERVLYVVHVNERRFSYVNDIVYLI